MANCRQNRVGGIVLHGWLVHPSGRPRGWVRRLLFNGRRPKPGLAPLVLDRAGNPRAVFAAWMEPVLAPPLPGQAEVRMLKSGQIDAQDDVVVLVVYAAEGQLSDLHRAQLGSYAHAGRRTVLVINSGAFPVPPAPMPEADVVLLRENRGFDFGGWRDALRVVSGLATARTVAFTNDSVIPLSDAALRDTLDRAAAAPQDAVFLTRSTQYQPHAQSYFFLLHRRALKSGAADWLGGIGDHATKEALIQQGELQLSAGLQAAGLSVSVLFDSAGLGKNPTIQSWDRLPKAGFPFLKVQLFETGLLTLDDPRVAALLTEEMRAAVAAHLRARHPSAG